MYRPKDLQNGLLHLWGWRQNYDPQEFTIADSLTQTETGRYFQEVHPLLTLDNIKSIAPDFKRVTYDTWSDTIQYRQGDRVTDSDKNYRAKEANINRPPETNPTQWERFDPFSEWLEEKTKGSILKAISSFWDDKMAGKTGNNILESKAIFNGSGRITNLESKGVNLVGFEIVPIRANGVTLKIEKIGAQFTGASEIKLYLMHSSQLNPIKEITLQRTKDSSMEWFTQEDLYLPYISDGTDAGGSWYIVYDQDSIGTSQAIYHDKDWSARPCYGCSFEETSAYNIWSQYLEFHPFKVSDFDMSPDLKMWDVSKNMYTYTTNYGLNFQITLECDITNVVLEQRRTFQNIIGLQMGVDMLREMAYNPNSNINRTQQNFSYSKQEILYELDGDSQGYKKSGLVWQLSQAMKAVSIDVTSISKVCFPCNNRGIRFRTV